MKKLSTIVMLLLLSMATSAQQWTSVNGNPPSKIKTKLIASSEKSIIVNVQVPGFFSNEVATPRGKAYVISMPRAVSTSKAGEPDLPMTAIPAIVGDTEHYDIRVVAANYIDYHDFEVAPSKGDFTREVNPDDVPYTYGEAYSKNEFFPASQAGLYEPYVLRDFRGQNMVMYPFAYNPVSKTLRVYHDITVEMFSDGADGDNQFSRKSNVVKMDQEIKAIYENQFINYEASLSKYTPIEEAGDLLIICHDAFMDAMTPFVNWKKQIGRNTTMVGTSVAGTTDSAIHNYITEQYNSNNNLMYVLLVGDVAQIPGHYYSSNDYSGKSDNWYGQIVGNDYYNDIFVGRFSAENTDHVTTQVNKVIHYERDVNASDTWLTVGSGVATTSQGGHFGEQDYQHIDNIRDDLLGYTYSEVHRDYPNAGSSAAVLSSHINDGVSIINYCNHGLPTSWGVFNYSNSHVNALTNVNKLPIIWSVACLNGQYDYGQPCFAEAWLRANNNSVEQPTGAIGGMFSYISQPWLPPMYGQDEMVDILVESYSNNIKRTLAGTSMNGNLKVLDQYGQNPGQGLGTYMAWILYGDPTLTLRNAIPADMGITHGNSIGNTSTSFTVNAANGNGAVATLTRNNEIMGSATISNGSCNITFSAPGTTGTATLTVFGYNKLTYIATVNITSGGGPDPVAVTCSANPTIIAQGASSTLDASATGGNGSFSYSWSPSSTLNNDKIKSPTATPSQTTTYNCTVTSGGQTGTGNVTVTVVCPPTNLTANVVNNNSVNLSWTAANPATSYKVYRNNAMIAQGITATSYSDNNLSQGTYTYSVSAVYQNVESPKSNTASATIYAPLSVTASASRNIYPLEPDCYTTLTATVTGGNGSYSYSWSPYGGTSNPTTVSPGAGSTKFTVTVTSNGQTAQADVIIEVVDSPETVVAEATGSNVLVSWTDAVLADSYNVYQMDDSFFNSVLIASGITGNSYLHENLDNGEHCYLVTAVYKGVESSVIVSDCATVFVCHAPEDFEASYLWEDNTFGAMLHWNKREDVDQSLTSFRVYKGLEESGEYEMIQEMPNVPGTYDYEFFDETAEPGSYFYKISSYYQEEDCETFTEPVRVEITDVEENGVAKVLAYPNPTSGTINVKAENVKSVSVLNVFGQVVYESSVDAGDFTIDLSQQAKGVYMLHFISSDGKVITRKVNVN